jgi:hypothetical protein
VVVAAAASLMVVVGLVGLGFPLNTFDFNEERKL